MRKATAAGMVVKIGRFGSAAEDYSAPVDSTVEEVFVLANISTNGEEKIWVNGEEATAKDILETGDIVNIITPKHAG